MLNATSGTIMPMATTAPAIAPSSRDSRLLLSVIPIQSLLVVCPANISVRRMSEPFRRNTNLPHIEYLRLAVVTE